MPEGYTHVRTARKAAETIHYKIQCPAAFAAGANGPDSFFCFEIWKKRAKRRLMLHLLLRQPFEEESLRSDFIDFCIAKITACSQPYAIRCYCMKLAYEQMKYYPELLEELRMALDMLEQEVLSPGMLSAKRQIMKKIKRSLGNFRK